MSHTHTHTQTDFQAGSCEHNDLEHEDIEMMMKCGAYEVVKLSGQRVAMNENPAYGEIGAGL